MSTRATDTSALFVRIPQVQARALDRLAFESGRPKQAVVSELLSRYIAAPERDDALPRRRGPLDEPALGWHSFRAYDGEVLTLEGVADLLEVEPARVAELAERGELPGRRIGEVWRFARSAVLDWLACTSLPDRADK